jgi:predicted MFS family arabinose efflux permease
LVFSGVYGFGSFVIGLIISGQGLLMAFNQMVGLKGFWLKKFTPKFLTVNFLLVFVVAFVFLGFKPLYLFAIGYFLLVFFQPVWRVVLTSEVVGKAGAGDKGEVMGVMTSILSLGMIVGPLMAGPLSAWHSYAPFWLCAILMFSAYIVLRQSHVKLEKIVKEEEVNVIG